MKLNGTNKKILSLLFSILMITTVFAGFMTPVVATEPIEQSSDSEPLVESTEKQIRIEQQLMEMEELRTQAQLKELEKLRREFELLAEEEIQRHFNELEGFHGEFESLTPPENQKHLNEVKILHEEVNTFSTNAVNEVVLFPDSNLEAAIRDAIGKPTGNLYHSDLEGLTGLSAPT